MQVLRRLVAIAESNKTNEKNFMVLEEVVQLGNSRRAVRSVNS